MMEFTFKLSYHLPGGPEEMETLLARLFDAGCDDAADNSAAPSRTFNLWLTGIQGGPA